MSEGAQEREAQRVRIREILAEAAGITQEYREVLLGASRKARHIRHLSWAIDKVMSDEVTTRTDNMQLCECAWSLFEIAGGLAREIEQDIDGGL